MSDITVLPGEKCPTCHIRMDALCADGSHILYGQGLGHLIVTDDGKKFVAKKMLEPMVHDIIQVAASVVSDPKLTADDSLYQSARRLLNSVADIPESVRLT